MENTLSFFLTDQTLNSHMAEPFSVFAANCPFFTDWKGPASIRANWKDFFSRRQDTPY